MNAIKKLIDGNGNQYFPQTHTKAVVDKVTKQLFGNKGTGNFILGPDVS